MAQYEVTLRDYWRILRRRKGIVLFTAFLVGFFSYVIATINKPVPEYTATAKVQLNAGDSPESLYMEAMSAYTSGGDGLETQQAIIESGPVLSQVADPLGWFRDSTSSEDTTKVILRLQTHISTELEGETNIIIIKVTYPDPIQARDMTILVAEAYKKYDFEKKNQQAVKYRKSLEKQRNKARDKLKQTEEAVRDYRQENDLVSLEAQAGIILGQLTQAERIVQQLGQIEKDLEAIQQEMGSEKGFSDETIQGASRAQVGDAFMSLSRELNGLRIERDVLLVQYTDQHPNVRQLDEKIRQLNRNLRKELEQRILNVEREFTGETVRLDSLRHKYNELPARGLELERWLREEAMAQAVAIELEEEYQTALVTEEAEIAQVEILQKPITPITEDNPHKPLQRGFMGVALGLIIGIVFAVVAETLDTSIGTIEDVQEYTGVQVVGIIPFINVDDVRASLRRRGTAEEDDQTVERKAQLVAFFDPQSTLAETYRTLRTNIEFVTVEKGIKCLMVTSSMHKEGKSTTISNLAMTMAQLGKQTLLVDCDLRRPSLPRLFGLDKEPGLTEVIVGNYQWRDIIRTVTDIVTGSMGMEDILQTQGISNLHILTSGSIPPNPAELLNSQRMEEFITEVRQAYDMVLFDSPPLLHVTDAAILGKKVDGALMVYKAGDIPRTSLKRSTGLLESVQIDLLGVVLNGIRADISSAFQDLSYYGYYAYGSDMNTPARSASERFQDYVRGWKRRLGLDGEPMPGQDIEEGAEEEEPGEGFEEGAEEEELGEELGEEALAAVDFEGGEDADGKGRWGGHILLSLVGLMLIWQSGYLAKPLGLIPVAAGYRSSKSVEERVSDEQAPEPEEWEEIVEERVPDGEVPEPEAWAEAVEERVADGGTPEPEEDKPGPQASTSLESPAVGTVGVEMDEKAVEEVPRGTTSRTESGQRIGSYTIRVASYPPSSKWAVQSLKRLRENDQEAFLIPVIVQEQQWERLLIGSFATWEETYKHARRLQEGGLIEEFMVLRLPYVIEFIFGDLDQARQAVQVLESRSYSADWQKLPDGSYRVLSGAFATDAEAQTYLANISIDSSSAQVIMR